MEANEIKKQLIEMIEAIDDDELLHLVKEDLVFHVTSKALRMENNKEVDAVSHECSDYSIAPHKNKIEDESFSTNIFDYL